MNVSRRNSAAAQPTADAARPRSSHSSGRRIFVGGAVALTALLLPALHSPLPRLVWNASASVPIGLYRLEPDAPPRVGDLVAVRPPPALMRFLAERHYVEAGALLLKPVEASGGAHVCRLGNMVTIDGEHAATALTRDRRGRPLPRWSGCRRLAPGELLLVADDMQGSFDSRYFGAIDTDHVIGRVVPLWTW